MVYSSKIIKLNDHLFMITNHTKYIKILSFFCLAASFLFIGYIIFSIIYMGARFWINTFLYIMGLFVAIYIANDYKKIIINTSDQKIVFKYGVYFKKTKEIDIGELKEISINKTIESAVSFRYKITNEDYNVDLIDKNLNAYRIYQSQYYDDELKVFAKNISEIINKELSDKFNLEGRNNIYNKLLI